MLGESDYEKIIRDEDGNIIDIIQDLPTDPVPEHEDSFYESEGARFVNTESSTDEQIIETKEQFDTATDELVNLFQDTLKKGRISSDDRYTIRDLIEKTAMAYSDSSDMLEKEKEKTLEEKLEEIKESMIKSTLDDLLNVLTENGTKCWIYRDDDGNILLDMKAIPQLPVLLNQLFIIASDENGESQLQLTPEFIRLISDKIIIDTKKLEINGTININDKAFYVGETGRTEIGGRTGHIIDDYDRAQLDINSFGTLYSVSKNIENLYAKLSEGYLQFVSGSQTAKITSAGIDTTSDVRLKENIELIDGRYEKLMLDISPISFNMKDDRENIPKRRNIGFSAQQVKSLMEDYNISYDEFNGLNKDENDIYSLNYSQFIPLNTYLMQQQNKRIIELERRVLELESKKE